MDILNGHIAVYALIPQEICGRLKLTLPLTSKVFGQPARGLPSPPTPLPNGSSAPSPGTPLTPPIISQRSIVFNVAGLELK